jgi:hypothetical protein
LADYGRRTAVESFNSELKTHRGKLTRGTTRCFAANKTEVLLAIYIAATNTVIIRDAYPVHPDLAPEGPTSDSSDTPKPVVRHRKRKEARHRLLALASGPPGVGRHVV